MNLESPRTARRVTVLLAATVVLLVLSPVLNLLAGVLRDPGDLIGVLQRAETWRMIGRSVALAVTVALGAMTLGTILAWVLVRARLPAFARGVLLILLVAPLAMPSYVIAFGLIAATGHEGLFGGLWPEFLRPTRQPAISSWIILVSCTYPYTMLAVRAALMKECTTLEEAALGLGAGRITAFAAIILPRLRPSIVWGGMLSGLYTLADFGAVSLVGFESITWGIYHRYTTAFGFADARALCIVLIVLSGLMILGLMRLRTVPDRASSAVPVPPAPIRFGPWSILLAALALLPVVIGVAVPLLAALGWLARTWTGTPQAGTQIGTQTAGEVLLAAGPAAGTTFMLAAAAAVLVPILVLPLVSLHVGASAAGRWARWLTPLTLLGFALPGLIVAIALAGLALRVDHALEWALRLPVDARLYQSHLVLLLSYAILFLPEAAGPLRAAAQRIHHEQIDAAEQFGGSALFRWSRITMPQLVPAFAAGSMLVFITTAKELPATLLLAPLNVETLGTRLWSAMEEVYFTVAAAAAIWLLGLVVLGVAVILIVERLSDSGRPES